MLPQDNQVPESIKMALVVCTLNCFLNPNVLLGLISAVENESTPLPIMADTGFQLPNAQLLATLRDSLAFDHLRSTYTIDLEIVMMIISNVFVNIGVAFEGNANASHLNMRAGEVVARIVTVADASGAGRECLATLTTTASDVEGGGSQTVSFQRIRKKDELTQHYQ